VRRLYAAVAGSAAEVLSLKTAGVWRQNGSGIPNEGRDDRDASRPGVAAMQGAKCQQRGEHALTSAALPGYGPTTPSLGEGRIATAGRIASTRPRRQELEPCYPPWSGNSRSPSTVAAARRCLKPSSCSRQRTTPSRIAASSLALGRASVSLGSQQPLGQREQALGEGGELWRAAMSSSRSAGIGPECSAPGRPCWSVLLPSA
jgi:hypothetical protein